MRSTGKVAIITGAGTGIGKRSALVLLKDGWSVALGDDGRNCWRRRGRRREKRVRMP